MGWIWWRLFRLSRRTLRLCDFCQGANFEEELHSLYRSPLFPITQPAIQEKLRAPAGPGPERNHLEAYKSPARKGSQGLARECIQRPAKALHVKTLETYASLVPNGIRKPAFG